MAGSSTNGVGVNGGTGSHPARPFPYEWMGPPGAALIMLALPVVVYLLHFQCTPTSCLSLDPKSPDFLRVENPFSQGLYPLLSSLFSVRATCVYLGWLMLHVFLYLALPAKVVQGGPLDKEGNRLSYPLNGLSSAIVSSLVVLALVWMGVIPVSQQNHSAPSVAPPHLRVATDELPMGCVNAVL